MNDTGKEMVLQRPDDAFLAGLPREHLREMLETLSHREQRVLIECFGLAGGTPKTLEEVGRQFRVSRDVIWQIAKTALRKLRHPSHLKKLGLLRHG